MSVPVNGLGQEPWEWNYTGFCGKVLQRSCVNSSSKPSSFAFNVPMTCACILILDQQSGCTRGEFVPLQHFFSVVPRSRYNITHIGFGFSTCAFQSELALASVSTRFSAQRPFDPIKQSSLAVNSRDTKHGFCSRLVWPFVDCNGKTERLLFSSRIF